MLELVFNNSTLDKKYGSIFFEKILVTCVRKLKLDNKNIEVSVSLVGERGIKELNWKYRKKNKVTDVLSFPMIKKFKIQNSKFKIIDIGDIFICLPFAKKEAKSENVSIEDKLAQLTVHSFLHLAGYDHEKSKNESYKMSDLEKRILHKL